MTEIQRRSQQAKEALRRAVAEALDKKRRLGQYAVIYQNGKPVYILPDQTREQEKPYSSPASLIPIYGATPRRLSANSNAGNVNANAHPYSV